MKRGKEVDVSVIIAVRHGNELAFREVYETYNARLYNFAYQFVRKPELCDEIVQETMISLWITRDRLDENYPIGAYLYTITRRLSLNMLRNLATSQIAFDQVSQSVLTFHNETEEAIIFSDLSCLAESIVTQLPIKQQEAFRLSRYQGLSHKQIAKRMELSENTIQNHISAALKKLYMKFRQADIFSLFLLYMMW